MNEPVKAQTPPASKPGGGESCTNFVHLRNSLAAIEAGITVATVKATKPSRHLTEREKCLRPLRESEKEKLARDREALVSGFENSRFLRGKLLWEYREGYRGSKGPWMKALKALADSDGVHINTIRNYIKDYEATMYLPESVRLALSDSGIDAAKKRNRTLIGRITDRLQSSSEPKQPNQEKARQIVVEETMKLPVKPDLSDVFEELNADEKLRHLIRKAIRGAVVNIPIAKRLEAIKLALEEEMYAVWGQKGPITITLTPHRSAITLDGLRLKSDDRTPEVAA